MGPFGHQNGLKTARTLTIKAFLELGFEPARAGEDVYSPNIVRNGVDKLDLGPKITNVGALLILLDGSDHKLKQVGIAGDHVVTVRTIVWRGWL